MTKWIQNGSDAGLESFQLSVFLRGLRQKQHRWGAAWCIHKRFNQRFCIETQKNSHGYCLEDVAILTQGKSSRRLQPSCQLDFQHLEIAYLVVSYVGAALPIETMCFLQLSPNPGESMLRLCSQAVPKRCQWKIDVWI